MPIDTLTRDDLERKKAVWDLGFETKELLRRTFRKIVDAECIMENIRQRIGKQSTVSLRKAFDALDWLGRGFLTTNEFKRTFDWYADLQGSSAYMRVDTVELEGMIRRFNKDKLNGRISLPEFIDELSAKCPEKPY